MINIHKLDRSEEIVDRITVWKQTKQFYASFPDLESEIIHDVEDNILQNLPKKFSDTTVELVKTDCVDEAILLKSKHFNPLLLNMADWFYAGGCIDFGASTQEEELFRRSNYFRSLHQKYYPLKAYTTILSHKVEFSRYGIDKGYQWMEKPVYIDCVAAPALEGPPLTSDRKAYKYEQHAQQMKKKIRTLFYIAQKNGNDSLVLSAWGCGAFHCPVEHTAELFREVMEEYRGVVKHVSFAILGPNFERFLEAYSAQDTSKK
jgi:uncharacterized protein (TIGR02452 family)